MSFKEYGRIVQEGEGDSFPEYGKIVEEPSRIRSLASAPVKGAIKEFSDIVEFGQKFLPKGELRPEQIRQFAEEKFPIQEREPEKYLERAGKLGVQTLVSPGGPLAKGVQIFGGAALGYAAEKLGLPEWAQSVFESLPSLYSGGKKIPLKSSQKKFGDWLRKQGLSEHEITPLLKDPEQLERWSSWASKGKKSRKLMESIYQKTGGIYDSIENAASNLPNAHISPQAATDFLQDAAKIIQSMPHKYRSLIKQDALDLIKSGGSFNDLTNFYKDLNAVIGPEHGGRAIVGRFKEPVLKAMKSISPELAEDFQLATDLYRTRATVKGSLISKTQADHFFDKGEALGIGAAVYNRDMNMMGKILTFAGSRLLAREMLINPRLQNISVRIGEALKHNKYTLAERFVTEFKDEIAKTNPELAATIPATEERKRSSE